MEPPTEAYLCFSRKQILYTVGAAQHFLRSNRPRYNSHVQQTSSSYLAAWFLNPREFKFTVDGLFIYHRESFTIQQEEVALTAAAAVAFWNRDSCDLVLTEAVPAPAEVAGIMLDREPKPGPLAWAVEALASWATRPSPTLTCLTPKSLLPFAASTPVVDGEVTTSSISEDPVTGTATSASGPTAKAGGGSLVGVDWIDMSDPRRVVATLVCNPMTWGTMS